MVLIIEVERKCFNLFSIHTCRAVILFESIPRAGYATITNNKKKTG